MLQTCSIGARSGFLRKSLDKRNAVLQGCHGQGKKSGKRNFFQVREKSVNFNFSQGNLEKVVKVREKSGFSKKFIVKRVLKNIISMNCMQFVVRNTT